MDVSNLAKIEALLFTATEPVKLGDLARVLGLSRGQLKEYLAVLKKEYAKKFHGLTLKEYDESYLLVTKAEYASYVQELHQLNQRISLSQAALETLAIIAYKQPITRSEIEEIRGVKAEKTLLTLSKYGLIEELGRKDSIGNPIVYGTTRKFLQHFDLKDLSQLPEIIEESE